MKIRFLASARREFIRAADWYDSRSPGLGDRFLDDLGRGLRAIAEFPQAHLATVGTYRRCLLAVFPYALIYRIDEFAGTIVIVAVAHNSRKPRYWLRRDSPRNR